MFVRVVHVRHVGMLVRQTVVTVRVRVGLARRILRSMLVLVMCIVDVWMGVFHRLVNVLVLMVLGQDVARRRGHQKAGGQQLEREGSPRKPMASTAPKNGAVEK